MKKLSLVLFFAALVGLASLTTPLMYLEVEADLQAQTPPCTVDCHLTVNVPFTVMFNQATTGMAATGFRIFIDGVQLGADIPVSALVGGVISVAGIMPPASGAHTLEVRAFNAVGVSAPMTMALIVDPAPPPPPPPPTNPPGTIGLTVMGSGVDSEENNFMSGSKVTMPNATGQLASISVFVASVDVLPANQLFQLALYSDNAGKPGTRLANSTSGVLVPNAWNTRPLTAPLMQPNTSYWLLYNTNGRTNADNNMRFNPATPGTGGWSAGGFAFGTWPATFPTTTLSNTMYSIFATFGGAPDSPVSLRVALSSK